METHHGRAGNNLILCCSLCPSRPHSAHTATPKQVLLLADSHNTTNLNLKCHCHAHKAHHYGLSGLEEEIKLFALFLMGKILFKVPWLSIRNKKKFFDHLKIHQLKFRNVLITFSVFYICACGQMRVSFSENWCEKCRSVQDFWFKNNMVTLNKHNTH